MLARRPMVPRRDTRSLRPRVVRYRTVSGFLADFDQNLSKGRVFVNDSEPLRCGARVRLTLSLGRITCRNITGRVTRAVAFGNESNEVPGMHVQIGDRDRARIASRLRDLAVD